MQTFDPSRPAMVHDELNQQAFEWQPEWQSSYEQYGALDGRRVSNWHGLLLKWLATDRAPPIEDATACTTAFLARSARAR